MILHELISYDVLRVIWWLLLGILLTGFAVMDGFDLGAAALLRAQDALIDYREHPGGHDVLWWQAALPAALTDALNS